MNQVNLLIIGAIPPPFHGTTLYLKQLIEFLPDDEFRIIHLDTSDHRDDLDNLGKLDWHNISLGLKNFLQLVGICLKHRPGIVYLCPSQNLAYLRDGMFILIASLLTRAKIVQHLHGSDFFNFYQRSSGWLKLFIDFTQNRVQHTIVLGESLRKIYFHWHPKERIHAIPNGIDLNFNINGKFSHTGLPILFFLGNLLKFKGIHILMQALVIVKQEFPGVLLKVAGKWADDPVFHQGSREIQTEIEQFIRENQLENNVAFLGVVSGREKEALLVDSDIFLLPSINEGLPLTILEAMAAGNPVIAVDGIGAIPDVVKPRETGILIREQDAKQLAEAILLLLRDAQLRRRMGQRAHQEFQKRFTQKAHVDQMKRLFRSILEEG